MIYNFQIIIKFSKSLSHHSLVCFIVSNLCLIYIFIIYVLFMFYCFYYIASFLCLMFLFFLFFNYLCFIIVEILYLLYFIIMMPRNFRIKENVKIIIML
jgi:hypothetical protein